jgi:hypothetical protein
MSDTFSFRGKHYAKCDKDGLYYRQEVLLNEIFQVPMHINRIPNGWQIRVKRQGSYLSRSFFDGPDPKKGPWAALAENERVIKKMQRSLSNATRELKSLFKAGEIEPREVALKKARQSISSQTRTGNSTGVPGLQVKLTIPKTSAREKTPYVIVHSRLGQGSDLMLGPSFRTSIFNLSPKLLKKQVFEAVKARKFMEYCQAHGKRFSMDRLRFLSFEQDRALSSEATLTNVSFDELIDDAEARWNLPHESVHTQQAEIDIDGRQAIEIQRTPKPGQRLQTMTFFYDVYDNSMQCQRVADLYRRYLGSSNGAISGSASRGRKPSSPSAFNSTSHKKTGMTGVTYATYSDSSRFEFIAVWHDGKRKRRKGYSVRKYGLKQAFTMARRTFNDEISKPEADSILDMRYRKLLPLLLKDLPQKIIDNLSLAEEFKGVSYSSCI